MEQQMQPADLGITARLSRSRGRTSRDQMANARVTRDEQRELVEAARADGKALSEWAREVLLERARGGANSGTVFTELIALRMLINNVLRSIVLGRTMSEKEYAQLIAEVKSNKHSAAADVLTQYQDGKRGSEK
jgi:hypothetical protein